MLFGFNIIVSLQLCWSLPHGGRSLMQPNKCEDNGQEGIPSSQIPHLPVLKMTNSPKKTFLNAKYLNSSHARVKKHCFTWQLLMHSWFVLLTLTPPSLQPFFLVAIYGRSMRMIPGYFLSSRQYPSFDPRSTVGA
jgi:hypothetical protein